MGDLMLIYTRKDVKKGEELTLNYLDSEVKYSVRTVKFYQMYNSTCGCELCHMDEMDSMSIERELLGRIFANDNNQSDHSIRLAKTKISNSSHLPTVGIGFKI